MSKQIKGINIRFEGDTSPLNKALSDVDKASKKTTSELNQINKALKFDAGNTVLLAQKQEMLQEAVQNSTKRLDALKQAQAEVDRQFQNGEISANVYREFQREIETTENVIRSYEKQMQSMQQEQQKVADSTRDMQKVFDLAGQTVDDFADILGDNLTRAIKEGRATSAQLEQALEKIGQSATGTEADINQLRDALNRMGSNGSLDELRRDLGRVGDEANDAASDVKNLGNELTGLAGGLAAGLGIGKVIEESLNADDTNVKIDIIFDVPEESKRAIKDAKIDVEKYGIDGAEALEGLRRQWALNKDASDEANAKIVQGAAAISKAYQGIDFLELVQETNEIASELKTTDDVALDLVQSLLKIGFPPEQLDIISEYGGQLQRAGYEAEQVKGILAAAVNTGTWNIDNLLDGLKEGRIRAAELGMGLSNSMKAAVKQAIGDVNKVTDAQITSMQSNFSKQENALSKSMDKRYNTISKSYDQQQKATEKSLDKEYNAVSKSYSKLEDEKSKSLQKQYDEVSKTYEKQLSELEKSLESELKAFEKASNEKIALIDKEYLEKLKLIDEERYNKLKAIEDEINGINAVQNAEDKRQQDKENADKRAELQQRVREAKDAKSRQEASKALRDFEERLRLQKAKDERKAQIETLKGEKESINEAFSEQKDNLKSQYDEKKQQTKDLLDAEKENLKERQNIEKNALKESNAQRLELLKENNAAELASYKELNAQKLTSLKEEHDARKEDSRERMQIELDAVREAHQAELESFKVMNAEKLELAKNPPDSAAYKAIEQQLESWGNAIAQGGDEGAKAFEDMTRWLSEMENATLKNALGIEIFGTKWEDQGEHIISTVLNAKTALDDMAESQSNVNDLVSKTDTSAMVELNEAFKKIMQALEPLLKVIAAVISAIANWMSENPKLASTIVAIVSVLGILVGLMTAIAPIITAVTSVMSVLGVTFGAIALGPIALIVAKISAVIAIVALLIAAFKPLSKFFKDLWNGIVDIFTTMVKKISGIFKGLFNTIKSPLNAVIEMINRLIGGLNNIKLPDWVPGIGGKGINIPEIPMLAKGTEYFKGGMAIVGEKGAELVEMPTGAKVHNANKTAQMLDSNQEITIPVTLELDGKVLARHTAKYNSREIYNNSKSQQRGGRK